MFFNGKETFTPEKDLSIAIIIISAPSKLHRWRYEKETWEKYEKESKKYNIDCIFTECVENFTFRANCKESYRPGIFQKTVETLKEYPNYDVYVRTNLSTFIIFPFIFFIVFSNLSKSDCVLLKAIIVAPASASAIEQALPRPLPAPVLKAYLFFKFIFRFYFIRI